MYSFEEFDFYVIQDVYTMSLVKEKPGTVVVYKSYDEKRAVFEEFITYEKLCKWIELEAKPLLRMMDRYIFEDIYTGKEPYVILFQKSANETEETTFMRELATEYKRKIK